MLYSSFIKIICIILISVAVSTTPVKTVHAFSLPDANSLLNITQNLIEGTAKTLSDTLIDGIGGKVSEFYKTITAYFGKDSDAPSPLDNNHDVPPDGDTSENKNSKETSAQKFADPTTEDMGSPFKITEEKSLSGYRNFTIELSGISRDEFESALSELQTAYVADIEELRNALSKKTSSNARMISLTQNIDDLSGVTLTNVTVNSVSGLTDEDIPDAINVDGYLPLLGGTLTGSLTGTDLTLSGDLNVTGTQTFTGALTDSSFSATSTTATSTIAGGFNVGSGGLVYDYSSGRIGIGTTTPQGVLHIDRPDISGSGYQSLVFDRQGDFTQRHLDLAGDDSFHITRTGIATDIRISNTGNVSIGTTVAAANSVLTVAATSSEAIPLTINLQDEQTADAFRVADSDSTTLALIDANGQLGIGTSTPSALLAVQGNALISGTTTVNGLIATSSALFAVDGGNVGIGTRNPAHPLHIKNSGGSNFVQVEADTSNATGIIFTDDANRGGITQTSGDIMKFFTGSLAVENERVRIDASGLIGIGTTSPSELLSVQGNILTSATTTTGGLTATGTVFLATDGGNVGIGTAAPEGVLHINSGTVNIASIFESSDDLSVISLMDDGTTNSLQVLVGADDDDFILYTGGAESVRVKSGDVGIGTSSPSAKLDVYTTGETNIARLYSGSKRLTTRYETDIDALSLFAWDESTGNYDDLLDFGRSDGNALNIDGVTGNVGIGTTSPDYPLDIDGDFRVGESGSTNALFVDATNGEVGIGTGVPDATLDIRSGVTDAHALPTALNINGAYITIGDDGGAAQTFSNGIGIKFYDTGVSHGSIKFDPSGKKFTIGRSNNVEHLQIDSGFETLTVDVANNQVGIGHTNPSRALQIVGSQYLTGDIDIFGADINLGTGSATSTLTSESGNLGVGTTSPAELFSVHGNALISGNLSVAGLTATGTAAFKGSATTTFGGPVGSDSGDFIIGAAAENDILLNPYGGNVGIGTESPSEILHVAGDGLIQQPSGSTVFTVQGGTGGQSSIKIISGDSSNDLQILSNSSGSYLTQNGGSAGLNLRARGGDFTISTDTDDTERLRIQKTTGNVGIGTTSPYAKLSIAGETVSEYFTATSTSATSTFQGTILAKDGGNVGVGLTNPESALDIEGDLTLNAGTAATINTEKDLTIQLDKDNDQGGETFSLINGAGNNLINISATDSTLNVGPSASLKSGQLNLGANDYIALDDTDNFFDFYIDNNQIMKLSLNGDSYFTTGGNVGIGTTTPLSLFNVHQDAVTAGSSSPMFRLDTNDSGNATDLFAQFTSDYDTTNDVEFAFLTNGSAYADGSWVGGGADVAEYMSASNPESLEPGDIVMIDAETSSMVKKADGTPYSPLVIGVVSTNPGLIAAGGEIEDSKDDQVLVALVGRVPVKVSLEGGNIKPGDRITSSSLPGVGMKATSSGQTIGIALEAFDGNKSEADSPSYQKTGTIPVFVNLSYTQLDSEIKGGEVLAEYDGEGESGLWSVDHYSGRIKFIAPLDLNDFDLINVRAIRGSQNRWSIDSYGRLIVEDLEVKGKTNTAELEIGTPENPQGITIYDEETGEPMCVKSVNKSLTLVEGKCGSGTSHEAESSPVIEETSAESASETNESEEPSPQQTQTEEGTATEEDQPQNQSEETTETKTESPDEPDQTDELESTHESSNEPTPDTNDEGDDSLDQGTDTDESDQTDNETQVTSTEEDTTNQTQEEQTSGEEIPEDSSEADTETKESSQNELQSEEPTSSQEASTESDDTKQESSTSEESEEQTAE